MKKILTLVLALIVAGGLLGLAAAQQARHEQTTAILGINGPAAEEPVKLAPAPVTQAAKNKKTEKSAAAAAPIKKCYCVASIGNLTSGVVHDYGIIASYGLIDPAANAKCALACATLVVARNSIQDATASCQSNNWNGGCVRGFSRVSPFGGVNPAGGTAGKLVCTAPVPAVTQQKCPPTWFCNSCSPVIAGGVTNDGKCRKEACNSDVIVPFPPNGTPIGTWGFFKDGGFWAWGTTANSGAPTTITITPATPGAGTWSTCP
jgi:hypothetical protein